MNHQTLFNIPFLASRWENNYTEFKSSGKDGELRAKLRNWNDRKILSETASEAAFIKLFFSEIWGYSMQGENPDGAYQCHPQFPVSQAGQLGGTGRADAGLGYFGTSSPISGISQVMCEFKDIHSGLDQKQNRKGNTRSPVRQCLDYIRESKAGLTGNEIVEPTWGIVTDMNEFRLYFRMTGDSQYQRFVINPASGNDDESLLGDSDSASFLRFIFWKIFHKTSILAERGTSHLEKLLKDQIVHEKALEKDFYLEYKAYREFLFKTISAANPDFKGTKGRLVRMTQCLLDRCLFILFCEDMGKSLEFPCDILRDLLIGYSRDQFYNPDDNMPWERLKNIFAAMRDGGVFGPHPINRFNGGLFESFPELEQLKIPAIVFCGKDQGAGDIEKLLSNPKTLLYFSAKYNFGIKDAGHSRVIDFYALGRIFEQSITELEIMEAEADGRTSVNLLSKRKRDGVYYTPEWVTAYIVAETVGASLREIKETLGLRDENRPDDKDIAEYKAFLKDRRRTARVAGEWLKALDAYRLSLDHFKVVDPACGSGAFLIQVLDFLRRERRWIVDESERVGHPELWDMDSVINSILSHNIYGVDINPESIEIAKLALWMHTASPGKPLSSLDHNIRCGNSLVAGDFAEFYRQKHDTLFEKVDENFKERVNAFAWEKAFPEVFVRGGFDCVVSNPPYVKLQNFQRVHEDVADYLVNAKLADGTPLYKSTQSGNFDLYLPFIEKGVRLLKADGKMGFIAPNLWMKNEYGATLRAYLKCGRNLDRWIDFKHFQIFDEAITYTALQFFRGSAVEAIKCNFAPDGDISHLDWDAPHTTVKYDALPKNDSWNLMPEIERKLLEHLFTQNKSLSNIAKNNAVGFRGIESGADEFYHFDKVGHTSYVGVKKGALKDMKGISVQLDDAIMRPLVSSDDAKRYESPNVIRHTIFPYTSTGRLLSEREISDKYPFTWNWFKQNELLLRKRDVGAMDRDDSWWGFTRPMNLEIQSCHKIGIPQTVERLKGFYDHSGSFCFNNVRVGGILVENEEIGWFLLGVLNSPVPDWVFRNISRPKEGGFFEANKQFIAPLPIPSATDEEKKRVADFAKKLQELHTKRRDLVVKFEERLNGNQTADDERKYSWLWANLEGASGTEKSRESKALAKQKIEEKRQEHYLELDARLSAGSSITVKNSDDGISLEINGFENLKIFTGSETAFIAAQWRHKTRDLNITGKFTAKRLVRDLLSLRKCENRELKDWFIEADKKIETLDLEIADVEKSLNLLVYKLYKLTTDEIKLVENG